MDGDDNDEKPSKPPKVSSKGKSKAKEVDIKKSFLDGEDDEVRRELTHYVLVSTSSREMPKEIPQARMRTMPRLLLRSTTSKVGLLTICLFTDPRKSSR